MPLSLAALTAQTAHVTLTIEGEPLEVDWYPRRYSSEMIHRIEALQHLADMGGAEALAALDTAADLLSQLVARWDLYEYINDDGTPGPMIAPTVERLRGCSLELLWVILMALIGEARMGEAKGTPRKRR